VGPYAYMFLYLSTQKYSFTNIIALILSSALLRTK